MSSRFRSRLLLPMAACALIACDREERRFTEAPPAGSPPGTTRFSTLQPGPAMITTTVSNRYDSNAYAVSQGQRLFAWYNCTGCHANGGGGMGPPLMDDQWIYGSDPAQIYQTIMEGRPNGMPSWAGRIPDQQVWQIVAYVRTMSALTPASARNSRPDHMMTLPRAQTIMSPERPKLSTLPPPSKAP
jgi:cytochrome c oxidase cbb3-type subunit III